MLLEVMLLTLAFTVVAATIASAVAFAPVKSDR